MPKLTVPSNDAGQSNVQPMSMSEVASSVASGAKIGQVQQTQGAEAIASAAKIGQIEQSLGEYVGQQGSEYLARSLKDMENTIYNIVQSNAAQDYNQQAQNKISQATAPASSPTDAYVKIKKLNPSLINQGLDQAATQVADQYGQAINNPEDKARFSQSINDLNTNRKLQAASSGRQAQIQLSNQALVQALNTDIQSGLSDSPDNLGYYAGTGLSRINAALEAGSISAQQAAQLGDTIRKSLYFGSLQVANQSNPQAVNAILANKTAQDLNITDAEYAQLSKQNKFALADASSLNKIQFQSQNEIQQAQNRLLVGQLQDDIKQGKATSAQIVEYYDSGKITYPQYEQLANSYLKAQTDTNSTWHIRSDISAAINSGQVLSDFTSKQIDDHFQNQVRSISQDGSLNVSLQDKVNIAKHYQGPVDSLAKTLQYDVSSGDPSRIKDAVQAYNSLQSSSPLVLSGIKDSKFTAYISALSNAYQYTTSLNSENIQKIHDSIYNVDGRHLAKRMNDFAAEDQFSPNNIKATIANMYEGGNPWYRGKDDVSNDTVSMLQPLFRDAYRITGDASSAIEMVKNQTKALIGHSNVNDTPRWGIDAGTIMALPPEAIYNGKASAEEIRSAVNNDVTPILPKGISPDQVMVGSDDRTIMEFRKGQSPSYFLYYKDGDGNEVILPKRWQLDQGSMDHINGQRQQVLGQTPAASAQSAASSQKIYTAADFAKKQIMEPQLADQRQSMGDLVDKFVNASTVPQIISHYPGDQMSKSTVGAAITRMLGPDQSAWRTGQTLQLINNILTKTGNPRSYLQYGTTTTQPTQGDIVVGKDTVGLFNGYKTIGNKTYVSIINAQSGLSDNKGKSFSLAESILPASDVKGYRTLPQPETYYRQVTARASAPEQAIRFNPYTGELARVPTGQERFNPYNMTTSLNNPNVEPDKTVLSPEGKLVSIKSMRQPITAGASVGKAAPDTADPTAQFSVSANTQSTGGEAGGHTDITKGSTWWDSIAQKSDNAVSGNPADIKLEMQNGQLMYPLYNPETGKYTKDPEEAKMLISNLMTRPMQSASTEDAKLVQAYLHNLFVSAKKRRKFTDKELEIIQRNLGGRTTNASN